MSCSELRKVGSSHVIGVLEDHRDAFAAEWL